MIKFSLPGYISHEPIIKFFYNIQKEHPEYFIENRIIDSAYDLPGNLIWNGGRIMWEYQKCEKIYDLVDSYRQLGLSLKHTCTNIFITDALLLDVLSNQYLAYCELEGDSVVVYTEDLADYIKNNYPKYRIIWSTARGEKDINKINSMSKNDMFVLDYNHNHNEDILSQLKHPQNIEILCAENCIGNCPERLEHYKTMSLVQLRVPKVTELQCPYAKPDHLSNFCVDTLSKTNAITNEDIDYLYSTYHIEHFKLSGRVLPPYFMIEIILYYLIKPEYRNMLR
jgi:collagenase-like PrtC family protease